MHECAPDVGLQQHDRGKHHVADNVANQPIERFELQPRGKIKQADDGRNTHRHLHGAGATNQLQQLVHQDRDDQDVEHVPPRYGRTSQ